MRCDMNTNERTDKRPVWRGELALLIVILINSFGVVLMLDSAAVGEGDSETENQVAHDKVDDLVSESHRKSCESCLVDI